MDWWLGMGRAEVDLGLAALIFPPRIGARKWRPNISAGESVLGTGWWLGAGRAEVESELVMPTLPPMVEGLEAKWLRGVAISAGKAVFRADSVGDSGVCIDVFPSIVIDCQILLLASKNHTD
jgi:hypothetical protein